MKLKRRVALAGVQLDELDSRIVITGVDEAAGKDNISAVNAAGLFGQRITNMRRDTLDVTVKFALDIRKNNMSARSELLEKINAWAANGGWLTLNYRPDRRLQVVLAQAPGAGDMFQWTNVFSIVFRAYSVPYWEDDTETVFAASKMAGAGSMTVTVPGNTRTELNIKVANKSGKTINNLSIMAGGNKIEFTGLALGGSQTLVIDHLRDQKLYTIRNRIGSTSVMAARTASSADDFVVSPGDCSINWTAERAVQLTVSCRGRYL